MIELSFWAKKKDKFNAFLEEIKNNFWKKIKMIHVTSAPELLLAVAVEVDGDHPRVLTLEGGVASDDASLRNFWHAAFWENAITGLKQWLITVWLICDDLPTHVYG